MAQWLALVVSGVDAPARSTRIETSPARAPTDARPTSSRRDRRSRRADERRATSVT
jgi:hypothetical protein